MNLSDFVSSSKNTSSLYQKLSTITFNSFAFWIQDVALFLTGKPAGIPSPLIGFSYRASGQSPLIKNDISIYPFINKVDTANGYVSKALDINVSMISPINENNTFAMNALKMNILVPALKAYAGRGGLFSLVTPFYIYRNCMLRGLVHDSHNDGIQGVNYTLELTQPLLAIDTLNSISLSTEVQRLNSGGI